MKYFIILAALFLIGCSDNKPVDNNDRFGNKIIETELSPQFTPNQGKTANAFVNCLVLIIKAERRVYDNRKIKFGVDQTLDKSFNEMLAAKCDDEWEAYVLEQRSTLSKQSDYDYSLTSWQYKPRAIRSIAQYVINN
jgi:hypothetical protein